MQGRRHEGEVRSANGDLCGSDPSVRQAQVVAADTKWPASPPRQQHIRAHKGNAKNTNATCGDRRKTDHARTEIGPQQQHGARKAYQAEPDSKCTEQDDPTDLDRSEAEAGVEAIAQGATAEDGNADIVADRKAHKGRQSDFPVGERAPDMANRQRIEPG
jgi:hypothetical protein